MDTWIDDLIREFQQLFSSSGINGFSGVNELKSKYQALLEAYQAGDYRAIQGILSGLGVNISPEQEKWLDNMISQQSTTEARDYETEMRDTSLTSAAEQLQKIGLSSSGVLQTGALSSNGVAAAANSHSNVSMQRYTQRLAMAKQLLSMTSQMASAGIYGNAYNAAKKASSTLSSAASHSAYNALFKSSSGGKTPSWDEMIKTIEGIPNVIGGSSGDLPF